MMRLVPAIALLALLYGCAAPPPSGTTPQAGLPGVSPRLGSTAVCVGEEQPCGATMHCCAGTTCHILGRFGSFCRRPMPGA